MATAATTDPQLESDSTNHKGLPNHLVSQVPEQYEPTTVTTAASVITTATTATLEEPDLLAQYEKPISPRWPGWPGDCVFRLIVPVSKVGSIIGKKGDLVKKLCEDTRARVRVLEGQTGTTDRVVLISGKEEPEALLSPAMDAVTRIFKRVSGLPEVHADLSGAAGAAFCSIRLLVASVHASYLIGKQGATIKSIQENTKASVRVMLEEEAPFYVAADERIVELQGEALNVLKALEVVVGHLRKFLVDHSVIPLFEKNYNNAIIPQDHQVETLSGKSMPGSTSPSVVERYFPERGALFLEREGRMESPIPPSYPAYRSSALSSTGGPIITQITQTMQVPISYAEVIIGTQGNTIAFIRRSSGAMICVEQNVESPDLVTVEIKGTSSEVQTAQRLIQELLSNAHQKESVPRSYGKYGSSLRSANTQFDDTSYPAPSLARQPYDDYGSSGLGGYRTRRI